MINNLCLANQLDVTVSETWRVRRGQKTAVHMVHISELELRRRQSIVQLIEKVLNRSSRYRRPGRGLRIGQVRCAGDRELSPRHDKQQARFGRWEATAVAVLVPAWHRDRVMSDDLSDD